MTRNQHWYRTVYLKSDHWLDLRSEKLSLNPFCQRCEGAGPYDVHHIRYGNIYDCTVKDLVTLCRGCHNAEHEKPSQLFDRNNQQSLKADMAKRQAAWEQARIKATGKTPWTKIAGTQKPKARPLRRECSTK